MTQQSHEQRVETLLREIRDALSGPPRRSATETVDPIIIRAVEVVTAGTIVQGPDVLLPEGYTVSIRQRPHTTGRTGYVGFSQNAVGNTATRIELQNNNAIGVRISNFKDAWFDANTNNTFFEMMAVR